METLWIAVVIVIGSIVLIAISKTNKTKEEEPRMNESPTPVSSRSTTNPTYNPQHNAPIQCRIVDVQMPFSSMVMFMVKWAIASIPAILILLFLGIALSALLGGFFGGLAKY